MGDDHVVLIGDAGHPHGGAYAAGGTMSIEDAYTLALCLEHALGSVDTKKTQIQLAFNMYNDIRHAHTARLIDAANKLRTQRKTDEGRVLSDEHIEERLRARPDISWLSENDTKGAVRRWIDERA